MSNALSPSWPLIVEAARACVGTRFRAQGRTIGLALDCVGLVLVAAKAAAVTIDDFPAYSLGGDHPALEPILARHGCAAVAIGEPGDILIMAPTPRRCHFGILTPAGVVHAHAGLGRVVEGPIDPEWAIIGQWRFPGAR